MSDVAAEAQYRPEASIDVPPVFAWPPQPLRALRWLVLEYLFPYGFIWIAASIVAWMYLTPDLEQMATFEAGWIALLWLRNAAMLMLVAGGLHWWLHARRAQGKAYKFDQRWLATDNGRYLFRDQVKDNIFWTMTSGVIVWTAYEVFFFWAMANNLMPYYLEWRNHPVSFVLIFFAIPFITSLHFHLVHRLLHWKPLFRIAHEVHHRNVILGPWSGFSMHPIEHLIYMSSVLIHVVLPSHPLHIIFHNQWNSIGAAATHSGYEALTFRGKPFLYLTTFHHQIHHRFLNCNYGNPLVPADQWFGCNNDGAKEANKLRT